MGAGSGGSRRSNSIRNKYCLNFQDDDNDKVEKLAAKLLHLKKSRGLKYTLLKATENDIIFFQYPEGKKCPKPSEFDNFKSFKGYSVFTEMNDVIKFDRKKKIAFKKANIRKAKTEDNRYVYWIRYI